jgi:hypothetical protein
MEDNLNPYASPEEPEDGATLMADLAAPAVVKPYATARPRARWAIALLAMILLGNLVAGGLQWSQIDLLGRMKTGKYTAQEATQNDIRIRSASGILVLANVGSWVAFLMWFHRSHRNLPSLGATGLRFTPGWAVGWWFIPVFSLFRPYQVMKEIWRGSDPATRPGLEEPPWPPPSTAMVGWWWGLFLLMGFAREASTFTTRDCHSINDWIGATWLGIGCCALTVIAALLAILVVRRVTANQEERFRLLAEQADPVARP